MRIAIPHELTREEVRRRMAGSSDQLKDYVPGGMADVETDWPNEDRMRLSVAAMGQEVTGHVDIEDAQVVFNVTLPPALSFFGPMIEKAIHKGGTKMLDDRSGRAAED